jgi:small subunit ribosomal protein S8
MPAKDTISDMLTRIRNACAVRHPTVAIPSTRITKNIAEVLKSEGFISGYEEEGEGIKKNIVVALKYKGRTRQPVIHNISSVSTPGLRVYKKKKELPRVLGGIGVAIISTSHGIMTDREARKQGIGGEILCHIW